MAEPKVGSAAVTLTVDKAQFAAEAKAAIVPAVANAGAEASKALSSTAGVSPGVQKMIDQQRQLATEARTAATATAKAINDEAAAADRAGNTATTSGNKLRGLGSAAGSVSGAFGGAAGEATRLASTLAYGGIAGGAAIGVAELVKLGDSMNDTSLSAEKLIALAGQTGEAASAAFKIGTTFGDPAKQLKELTQEGAAGIGTLLNMRDAMLAAGQDTSAIDTALEQFNVTFNTTGETVARGKDYIDQLGGSERQAAIETEYLTQASQRLESQTRNSASAAQSLLTSQTSIVGAQNRLRQAQEALANFGSASNAKSILQSRNEAQAIDDASKRIVDARQKILDAEQKVADAREKFADAGKHELLDVQDAQDAVDAAQRKLNASTPEERGPAQHALQDAQQKLEDAKHALDKAKPDAERALNEAVRNLTDAHRDEIRSSEDLTDAQLRQSESAQSAVRSQGDYQSAVDGVTEAQLALVQATVDQKIKNEELQSGIKTGPVEALGILRQALRDLAADLDPSSELAQRIAYLLASMSPEGAQQVLKIAGGGSTPGGVAKFASGGFAPAGLIEGAENGPELMVKHGLYSVPSGGREIVNARDTATMLGGSTKHFSQTIHFHGDVDPYKAAREQRRELERFAALAGG